MGDTLIDSYFDPAEPGSYAGASKYHRHHPNIKYDKLANILSGYRGYTIHKQARRRFPRNRTIVGGIDAQWDVDLADVTRLAEKNDGYKFWLCVIDVFSKKTWVQPIRSKTAPEVVSGFKEIFQNTNRRPRVVRSDKGREFNNKYLKEFLKKYKIDYFTSQNEEIHAALAERVIKTIKGRVFRYLTHNRTDRYIDVLGKLVSSYNATYHRTIGRAPDDVTKEDEAKIWRRLYGGAVLYNPNFKFKIGDRVRITGQRYAFQKAYEGLWTEEVFKISKQIPRQPPVYKLVDWNEEELIGTFYEYELQKITLKDDVFIIEKVLRTKRSKGKTQYFVKWLGYPSKFNSWTESLL